MLNSTWPTVVVFLLLSAVTTLDWGVPPPPLPPLWLQLERRIIIDSTDRSGQGSRNMNTHTCQSVGEEEGGADVSACLIVALILWQWHTVNSDSETLRPPGPEMVWNQLTFIQRHTDIKHRGGGHSCRSAGSHCRKKKHTCLDLTA